MKYWFFLVMLSSLQAASTEFSELESKLKKQSKEFITLKEKIENGEKRLGELDVQQGSVRDRIKNMKEEFELLSVQSSRTESKIKKDNSRYKIIRENQSLARKNSVSTRLNFLLASIMSTKTVIAPSCKFYSMQKIVKTSRIA